MEQKREKRKACNRDGAKEREEETMQLRWRKSGRGRHATEMEKEGKRKACNRNGERGEEEGIQQRRRKSGR